MTDTTAEWQDFLERHPQTSHLDVLLADLCGNVIGKRLPVSAMSSVFSSGTPVCAAMQLVDVMGNTADPMGYGFSDGDPDAFDDQLYHLHNSRPRAERSDRQPADDDHA